MAVHRFVVELSQTSSKRGDAHLNIMFSTVFNFSCVYKTLLPEWLLYVFCKSQCRRRGTIE